MPFIVDFPITRSPTLMTEGIDTLAAPSRACLAGAAFASLLISISSSIVGILFGRLLAGVEPGVGLWVLDVNRKRWLRCEGFFSNKC